MIRFLPLFLIACLAALLWSGGFAREITLARIIEGRDLLQALVAERPLGNKGLQQITPLDDTRQRDLAGKTARPQKSRQTSNEEQG